MARPTRSHWLPDQVEKALPATATIGKKTTINIG
jgi:hypothetical protein